MVQAQNFQGVEVGQVGSYREVKLPDRHICVGDGDVLEGMRQVEQILQQDIDALGAHVVRPVCVAEGVFEVDQERACFQDLVERLVDDVAALEAQYFEVEDSRA